MPVVQQCGECRPCCQLRLPASADQGEHSHHGRTITLSHRSGFAITSTKRGAGPSPVGYMQNVRVRLPDSMKDDAFGLCQGPNSGALIKNVVTPSKSLFNASVITALRAKCPVPHGYSPITTPEQACAASKKPIDTAKSLCKHLEGKSAGIRDYYNECLFDWCALGGDNSVVALLDSEVTQDADEDKKHPIAGCPGGYVQVGTTSSNNAIKGDCWPDSSKCVDKQPPQGWTTKTCAGQQARGKCHTCPKGNCDWLRYNRRHGALCWKTCAAGFAGVLKHFCSTGKEACAAACNADKNCVSFNYSPKAQLRNVGSSTETCAHHCELHNLKAAKPNWSWGTDNYFCAKIKD